MCIGSAVLSKFTFPVFLWIPSYFRAERGEEEYFMASCVIVPEQFSRLVRSLTLFVVGYGYDAVSLVVCRYCACTFRHKCVRMQGGNTGIRIAAFFYKPVFFRIVDLFRS